MKHSYEEIAKKIQSLQPFVGNSSRGVIIANQLIIYSYTTTIAIINTKGVRVFFDEEKYSQTTSRLQNLIRKYTL